MTPEPSGQSETKAFEVSVKTWTPPHSGIYAASSASKAKYQAWKAAQEAGYDEIRFDDLRVIRAPEFDCIASKLKHGVDRTYASLLKQSLTRAHAILTGIPQ